jgi:hypothetical protein
MKNIGYSGIEGDALVIEQPTDIYPLLDWCQSRMIENQEKAKGTKNIEKWEKSINYLNELMDDAESKGFGNMDDVDMTR